ncbi:MAG: hypothetical protein J6P40_02550 [Oscillospiraceae bacterium]|nr:hypothetical protein [Oscillospiraceae bacterium]
MSVRLTRNDTEFWYCPYDATVQYIVIDENGNETGETAPRYGEAVKLWANVSPASGAAQFEQFGNMGNYDKVIVTRDMEFPIAENGVLFLDKEPEYVTVTAYEVVEGNALYADDEAVPVTYQLPKYDYIVKRVAKGLDAIAIAVRKVDVG